MIDQNENDRSLPDCPMDKMAVLSSEQTQQPHILGGVVFINNTLHKLREAKKFAGLVTITDSDFTHNMVVGSLGIIACENTGDTITSQNPQQFGKRMTQQVKARKASQNYLNLRKKRF